MCGSIDTIRIRDKLLPPKTGLYTFEIWCDDFCSLEIGGNKLIDTISSRANQCINSRSGQIYLEANKFVNFLVDILDTGGAEGVEVFWEYPGQSLQWIPAKYVWYPQYIPSDSFIINDCVFDLCTSCKNYVCYSCQNGYTLISNLCLYNCGAGNYRNPSTPYSCSLCPIDTYNSKPDSIALSDCLSCGEGKFSPPGSTSVNSCRIFYTVGCGQYCDKKCAETTTPNSNCLRCIANTKKTQVGIIFTCERCLDNFKFYKGECVPIINDDYKCHSLCKNGCLVEKNQTMCISCKAGKNIKGIIIDDIYTCTCDNLSYLEDGLCIFSDNCHRNCLGRCTQRNDLQACAHSIPEGSCIYNINDRDYDCTIDCPGDLLLSIVSKVKE